MGAGNVKAVYALWADLPDRPFRVLAYMALTAKDADDPPMFWGGRESLAVAIGRKVSPNDSEASVRTTFRAVRSAVKHRRGRRHQARPASRAGVSQPAMPCSSGRTGGTYSPLNRGDLLPLPGGLDVTTGGTCCTNRGE
jgi:hypothetical protein